MPRLSIIGASLILLTMASAGCLGKKHPDVPGEKTQTNPTITPEQARAALLKLGSLRVLTGGADDPIAVDLRSGSIARTDSSSVTIGKFFSCNLKEKTWQMAVSNPSIHFRAGANGTFELQSDGTWLAIQTGRFIT